MMQKPQNQNGCYLREELAPSLPVDPAEAKELLVECFNRWADDIELEELDLHGMLIVCDPRGMKLASRTLRSPIQREIGRIADWSSEHVGDHAVRRSLSMLQFVQVPRSEHTYEPLTNYHTAAIPILSDESTPIGALALVYDNHSSTPDKQVSVMLRAMADGLRSRCILEHMRRSGEHQMSSLAYYETELKKRDVLFQMASKLHANMDVDSVLSNIVHSMKEVYPAANIELYLTQDNQSNLSTVKPLMFRPEDEGIHIRAYLEGEPIYDQLGDGEEAVRRLAVPLKGKQGVYGVLLVDTGESASMELDVPFISNLADSAGMAFENARLHESSNVLINELRMINEITRRLNQSLKLQEVFQFASDELIKIFKADFGLILQTDPDNGKMVVQSSNLSEMDRDTFSLDYGFAGIMLSTKEPIIISDYSLNPKVRSKLMESTGARSMIGSPIIVGSEVVGVIMMAHRLPHYFSYDNFKLLQVLSGHIGLAITNASLHAEVRRMVVTDTLTGLYARHYLDEQIKQLQKKDFCGSLILMDIDLFKNINDTYGHQIGDQALKQVCEIIKSSIRESDIAARWGGEELAVYLPQLTIEQTLRIAERIRARIEHETNPQVTVSCGISQWSWEDDKISVESLFYRADMALYEAKREGRNRIKVG